MRFRIALAGLLILLLLSSYACATNGFLTEPIPVFPKPTADAGVLLQMGWYNDTQAWFFCTTTNDLRYVGFGRLNRLTLAPKLSSALVPRVPGGPTAARPMYFVTNFQNPPIFSTAPGQPDYSALWQVFNITWKPGVTRRPICNAEPASPSNPTGIPGPAEADIVATNTVLDCPILVLGRLVNPFTSGGTNYKIPQSGSIDVRNRIIFMPAWLVYCHNPVNNGIGPAFAQITDVSDPALAAVLGANLAPGLLNMPDSDTTDFFVMRGPKPLTQFPVVRDCPAFFHPTGPYYFGTNINYNYSPVMRYIILQRNTPPNCLIKTADFIDFLLGTGGLLILKDDQRINAAIVLAG